MADFVAVLRKTIGSLGDNTPEMREKVYEKARATIEAKLAALTPPPPAAVADRQRKALEDAIAVVRADYAPPAAAPDDALDDVFASLKSMGDLSVKETPRAPEPPRPAAVIPTPPRVEQAAQDRRPPEIAPVTRQPVMPPPAASPARPSVAPASPAAPEPALSPVEPAVDAADRPEVERDAPPAGRRRAPEAAGRSRRGGLVAAALAVLVVAGGAYALWLNKDDLLSIAGLTTDPAVEEPADDAAVVAEDLGPEEPAPEAEQEVAAAAPEQSAPPPATELEKFTQRLLPDGSETDEGPAGGPRSIGEGSSIASVAVPPQETTQAAPADDVAAGEQAAPQPETDVAASTEPETQPAGTTAEGQPPAAAAQPAPAGQPAAQSTPPAVAVGQRAIFYEERTSSAQGSAEMGSIVWSVVRESPGGDLPPEPAIRAEATVPGKDVQLRMTIRRNGDETLPASHIVEMIFLTPEGFEGGAIANVSRISFKETEQAAGNPLIGIPAKIADGFFLIALGDAPAEIEANMTLLRRQSWVDIPIVYQSGRRALLSLEKGIPGDRVFEETLRAWSEASSG